MMKDETRTLEDKRQKATPTLANSAFFREKRAWGAPEEDGNGSSGAHR